MCCVDQVLDPGGRLFLPTLVPQSPNRSSESHKELGGILKPNPDISQRGKVNTEQEGRSLKVSWGVSGKVRASPLVLGS